jgi:hypothetical protein
MWQAGVGEDRSDEEVLDEDQVRRAVTSPMVDGGAG